MDDTMARPTKDCIWLAMQDSQLRQDIVAYLEGSFGDYLVADAELVPGSTVGLVIADEPNRKALEDARDLNAGVLQSIFIASGPRADVQPDFLLPSDVGIETVVSVLRSAKDFHDQVMSLKSDVASRKSAIGTIIQGEFVLRTLDEARNLATMIALACPNPDLVAIGLQELLINAVEHGNLEIDSALKQELLMEGRWREEIEARLADPLYADRVVILALKRGERMISLVIQDEGDGFDHETTLSGSMPSDGYRGRGIAMARDLAFSSLAYLGAGNVVEATILL